MLTAFGRCHLQRFASLPLILTLAGCAIGNRYDYSHSIAGLPITGGGKLAVDVVDARPYVLNHEKSPNFIGLQRGGFGNPFDVTTKSGRPLADEMRDAIANSLERRGFTVVGTKDPAPRKLELRVQEWKSDVMMRFSIHYDLTLIVYDAQGAVIASSTAKGSDVQGAGLESANATIAAHEFEQRFTELIQDQAVNHALSASQP